jgi:hypothetical protein
MIDTFADALKASLLLLGVVTALGITSLVVVAFGVAIRQQLHAGDRG